MSFGAYLSHQILGEIQNSSGVGEQGEPFLLHLEWKGLRDSTHKEIYIKF